MLTSTTTDHKTTTRIIPVEAIGKDGTRLKRTLKATVINIPKAMTGTATAEELADLGMPQSAAQDEEKVTSLSSSSNALIDPPYPLLMLTTLVENNTELGQNIRAMVTNTVGFGYQLKERRLPETVDREEVAEEKEEGHAFLGCVHVKWSLDQLMKRVTYDLHACGNGYLELIDGADGELAAMNHVHGHSIRLAKQDAYATMADVPRVRPGNGFKVEYVKRAHRFRRFAQVRNQALVWFKEAGDPRQMDRRTGRYLKLGESLAPKFRATSLIHFALYSPFTPYGVPYWIGNLFSIFGSRGAELTNYRTITQNNIPSMFVMVENGSLTSASIKRLRQFAEEQVAPGANMSKFIILEAEPMDEGMPDPTKLSIKVQPLKHLQTTDELFQDYDKNNKDKIRQAFRLPPIFVGRSDDYTRATADTSKALADEQVFAPERRDHNHLLTRFVVLPMGLRYHVFTFNTPNITDDLELVRMMVASEKSGAMTPRRADRIIKDVFGDEVGPMPQGINLDQPYSLQFAAAQQGSGAAAGMFGGGRPPMTPNGLEEDAASKFVSDLVSLRKMLDDELESRLLLPEVWQEAA